MDLDNYPHKVAPYAHQAEILKETWHLPSWALFMEMGTGKSKLAIDTFCMQYMAGMVDSVLIIAKKGEYANWVYDQLPRHLPDCVDAKVYLYSTYAQRTKKGKAGYADMVGHSGLRIMVVNVEALISKVTKEALSHFYSQASGVCMILDESTCVKNHKSARAKEAYKWAAKSRTRRIMTGTSITQSPMDLWGQSLALGKGLLGPTSFYAFRGRYAVLETQHLGSRAIQTIKGYQRLDELARVVKGFSTQVLKDECLDLPEKIYQRLYVELTPAQKEAYSDLKDKAILQIDGGGQLTVTNALSLMTKLHQVVCGQLKLEDGTYVSLENNRISAVLEKLEDFNGKAIIWANYVQTIEDLTSALEEKFGEHSTGSYYGGTSADERQALVKGFQDPDNPLRFLVANPQTAGYGLTLTQATLVIYYSNSFNLEHRLQSEDRAHRIGQTSVVNYIDLVSPDTVDERIIDALRQKKNISDIVLDRASLKSWL